MMTQSEFNQTISVQIRDYLPEEYGDAAVNLTTQVKQNDVEKTGLSIRMPGETVSPIIYLEPYYKMYTDGKPIEEVFRSIAEIRITSIDERMQGLDPGLFMDYSYMKDKLQMRLFDTEKNEKKLDGLVHYSFGDLSAAYSVVLGESRSGTMSMMVTPEIFRQWGISKLELHQDAMAADQRRVPILSDLYGMSESIFTGQKPVNYLAEPEQAAELDMPMLVLTNGSGCYGASLIVNPDLQEKIAGILEDDFYVLPSSVHEVIILAAHGGHGMRAADLNMMVRQINETEVSPEDRLSDKVQYYSRSARTLMNAAEYERSHDREQAPIKDKSI